MHLSEAEEAAHGRERPCRAALGEAAPLHLSQEPADGQPINGLPGPLATAVAPEKLDERVEVARIGLHRMGRLLALVGEMTEELRDVGVSYSALRHAVKSSTARATSAAFFASFFTLPGSGSSSPKFAFIGWKCFGSASRR